MTDILAEAIAVVAECCPGDIDRQIAAALTATYGEHHIVDVEQLPVLPLFPHGTRGFLVLFRHPMKNGGICTHISKVYIYGHNQITVDVITTNPMSYDDIIRALMHDGKE